MGQQLLGVDVGGTGIKAAIVDVKKGTLLTERFKFATPQPATPQAVLSTIQKLIRKLDWKKGPIGCGFPAVVTNGITKTASNIDKSWIDFQAEEYFRKELKLPFYLVNDADAAGIAEQRYGSASSYTGTVLLLTIGTGIGSALFVNGILVPNTEFGHLGYKSGVVEDYVSNKARKANKLSYTKWGKELNEVLKYYLRVVCPEVIVLGGGLSKRFDLYSRYLNPGVPVITATHYNDAGVIGAAAYAVDREN